MKPASLRAAIAAILCSSALFTAAHADSKLIDVPAGDLVVALESLAKQAGVEFFYQTEQLKGLRTQGARGNLSPEEAVTKLLQGTSLTLTTDKSSGALLIVAPTATTPAGYQKSSFAVAGGNGAVRLAQADLPRDADKSAAVKDSALGRDVPEVLVEGSRILNMDIRRTRDDVQPYVTFDREAIERSGATDLNDFFKQRLTMNSTGTSAVQNAGAQLGGAQGEINLRGMGSNKTLVLIDGRRVSAPSFNNTVYQANINTIPLGAVERVEVLPATSAGIYGGAATGGVVNIILKRDFSGVDVRFGYDNTFDTDSSMQRADVAGGWSSANGRTNITGFASTSNANGMSTSDRDFLARARYRMLQNNPSGAYSVQTLPVGTTTNIASANGQNLVLDNGTPLNSLFTYAPAGYAGAASDGGAALVANAGSYNFAVSPTAQVALTPVSTGGERTLLQASELNSAMLTVRHAFTSSLDGYVSGMWNEQLGGSELGVGGVFTLPANAPTNPFQQAVMVRVPSSDFVTQTSNRNLGQTLNAGLIARLPNDLAVSLDYGWSRAELKFEFPRGFITPAGTAAVTTGAVDALRDPNFYETDFLPYLAHSQYSIKPFKSTVQNGSLRFSKPAWQLPAGRLTFAGLLERREEKMDEGSYYQGNSVSEAVYVFPDRSQTITSAYLETTVPLVSASNRKPLVENWQLQLAVRRDEYEINGSTGAYALSASPPQVDRATKRLGSTDFTFGTMYSPVKSLALRASYGTGFMPPSVTQLVASSPGLITAGQGYLDPRRGNEVIAATSQGGGSTSLDPEQSRSFSAGLVFSPSALDLRLSLDYVLAEQDDLIGLPPGGVLGFIQYENLFPGRVVRAAPAPGDPYGVGAITHVDATSINLGQVNVEAFDAALDWRTTLPKGELAVALAGTLQTKYEVQLLDGAPLTNYVGVSATYPLRFKGNASVTWSLDNWSVGWSSRYFDSYVTADPSLNSNATYVLTQGHNGHVPSQLYHDLVIRHSLDMSGGVGSRLGGFLNGLEVQLGVRNVFNTSPPLDAYAYSAGFYSPYGDPRLASYWLSIRASM
ncbi:TonB-dependent receptor [Peristeroidobacter soli]|uniref:TonB-dependent receptor n=1 Tax=Peristeroidobacter soli TaxID=2497877 RepID=UPI00101C2795|nr:TonB-dependent receptor [Peristeroidobacter soli]